MELVILHRFAQGLRQLADLFFVASIGGITRDDIGYIKVTQWQPGELPHAATKLFRVIPGQVLKLHSAAVQLGQFQLEVDSRCFGAIRAQIQQQRVTIANPGFFDRFVSSPRPVIQGGTA